MPKDWSKNEEKWLRKNYKKFTNKELGNHFGVNLDSIRHKLRFLGLRKRKFWTKKDIKYLKENYNKKPYYELAKDLNVNGGSIQHKVSRLKLRIMHSWDKNKIIGEILRLNSEDFPLNYDYMYYHNNPLHRSACYYFGSWKSAITASGLNYDNIRLIAEAGKVAKANVYVSRKKMKRELVEEFVKVYTTDTNIVTFKKQNPLLSKRIVKMFSSFKKFSSYVNMDYCRFNYSSISVKERVNFLDKLVYAKYGKSLKDYLIFQYKNKKKSVNGICKEIDIGIPLREVVVRKIFKFYNIPIRSYSEASKLKVGKKNPFFGKKHSKESMKKMVRTRRERGSYNFSEELMRRMIINSRKSMHIRPTNPEKKFIELCKSHNLPYNYVGDGKFWIGNKNPDFIHKNSKKEVVEIFGDYWHSPLRNPRMRESTTYTATMKHYKRYGFNCLIIWEHELKEDLNRVLNKFIN